MERVLLNEPEKQISGRENSSSKGDQPKWRRGDIWYKADYMGYEGAAEVVISRLLKKSDVPDFVSYSPVELQSGERVFTGCKSANFRGSDQMLVTFERLYRSYTGRGLAGELGKIFPAEEKLRFVVDFVEEKTGLRNVGAYLTMLLEMDAFFLNEDRHTNNLAVIRSESTGMYSLCPVFDNGLALLSDTRTDYPMEGDVYALMEKVKAKPFKEDFSEQMEAAENLYGSRLHFTFTRRDAEAAVESLKPYYDDAVCRRIETILLEQMRKYPIFF